MYLTWFWLGDIEVKVLFAESAGHERHISMPCMGSGSCNVPSFVDSGAVFVHRDQRVKNLFPVVLLPGVEHTTSQLHLHVMESVS